MVILTSRDYLLSHIAALRNSVSVKTTVDQRNVTLLEEELSTLAARHLALGRIRFVVFVFLYASILSNLALPALTTLVKTFTLVANLLGAGILSLVALYLTWRLNQLWNRMSVVGGHLIAIYEKHNKGSYSIKSKRDTLATFKQKLLKKKSNFADL